MVLYDANQQAQSYYLGDEYYDYYDNLAYGEKEVTQTEASESASQGKAKRKRKQRKRGKEGEGRGEIA